MNTATKFKPNEKQQECIDNIEGKYLVLAGPGTGKTYTIIQRIKSMIERKINPEKILCLTFSDAATNEMRTRLEKELNRADFGVNIYTYHGFCNEIISENLADFELPNNFKVITSAMSNQLLKECIDEIEAGNGFFIKGSLEVLEEMKQELDAIGATSKMKYRDKQ